MEDFTKEALKLSDNIKKLLIEREENLQEAIILENEAKDKRARALQCKRDIQSLQTALNNVEVKGRILTDEQAIAKVRAEAEAHTNALAEELEKTRKLREQLEAMTGNTVPNKDE